MHELRPIRNIALIGFMGTGKSSVGHLVAGLLHFAMVDTDVLIEAKAGKRIAELFRDEGEARFRQFEAEIVGELAQLSQSVIATGGGLGANPAHVASLKTHALVVCLWASPQSIWERVKHQSHRPLLECPDPLARIHDLLAEREPFYKQADVLVNTDLRSPREVANHVVHEFKSLRR